MRIVFASGFVDSLWIGGQFVVEAVEEDPFATRNQALFVRPVEVKVPGFGIAELHCPVADSADVIRDQRRLLDSQRVEHLGDIPRFGFFVVA